MKKGILGYFIIGSAVIWGTVMIGCAVILKGTGYYQKISLPLIGGVVFHLLFIWGPLGAIIGKKNGGQTK